MSEFNKWQDLIESIEEEIRETTKIEIATKLLMMGNTIEIVEEATSLGIVKIKEIEINLTDKKQKPAKKLTFEELKKKAAQLKPNKKAVPKEEKSSTDNNPVTKVISKGKGIIGRFKKS